MAGTWTTYGALAALGAGSLFMGFGGTEENMERSALTSPSAIDISQLEMPAPEATPGVQDLRDGMIVPHFFKVRGIAETLEAAGADIPAGLELRLAYAARLSDAKFDQYEGRDDMLVAFEMARSEGELESRNGEWTVGALESYIDRVMELDQRYENVVSSAKAYLQDEGIPGDDADYYVRRSIALALFDHLQPGFASASPDDTRLEIRAEGHTGVVGDLHEKMHTFFQHRLRDLDEVEQTVQASRAFPAEEMEGDIPDEEDVMEM